MKIPKEIGEFDLQQKRFMFLALQLQVLACRSPGDILSMYSLVNLWLNLVNPSQWLIVPNQLRERLVWLRQDDYILDHWSLLTWWDQRVLRSFPCSHRALTVAFELALTFTQASTCNGKQWQCKRQCENGLGSHPCFEILGFIMKVWTKGTIMFKPFGWHPELVETSLF